MTKQRRLIDRERIMVQLCREMQMEERETRERGHSGGPPTEVSWVWTVAHFFPCLSALSHSLPRALPAGITEPV